MVTGVGAAVPGASHPGVPNKCLSRAGQIVQTVVASTVYGGDVPATLYLPPCYDVQAVRLPVIYLLHGGNADETQWPDLRVQLEADALIASGVPPFVVVMPGGAYRDNVDYATFIRHDLLPSIGSHFRVRTDSGGRAIGGLSLGGYWALKVAFLHPDQFAAVGGNSPVVSRGNADDPLLLARTAEGLDRLRVSLDVGDSDSLRHGTERLAQALESRHLKVNFAVNPGGHNRSYWRAHTAEYLRFYLSAMRPASLRRRPCRGR